MLRSEPGEKRKGRQRHVDWELKLLEPPKRAPYSAARAILATLGADENCATSWLASAVLQHRYSCALLCRLPGRGMLAWCWRAESLEVWVRGTLAFGWHVWESAVALWT